MSSIRIGSQVRRHLRHWWRGTNSGHHEHRRPNTRVATEARGRQSTFRRSIARLVPQSGGTRRAVAFLRSARLGSSATTTCRGSRPVAHPALDDGLRLGARGRVGIPPLGSCANVESPRQHSHRGRIAESIRLIKWRNARLGSGANHEGACRAFSMILHIGVFERRRRSYWRRSLTTRSRRPQPSKSPRNTNV
jgi:hypothetical protein